MMGVKALISPGYRWRLGMIALILLGFGAYCWYDAAYSYPRRNRIVDSYIYYSEQGILDQWPKHARDQGWPEDKYTEPGQKKSQGEIIAWYVVGGLCVPLGLWVGGLFIRSRNWWIAVDDNGLHTSWGQGTSYIAIKELNKRLWRSKGIAMVRYYDGESERRLTLDDWKYDREATTALVERIEQALRPEQIVGDDVPKPTEPAV